ncbi:MAG TPA: hypothetical protein VNW52_10095, partial [Burkholderiaceae bacterium]|nr:hypothetical protein [Burkholderiaceae bacterium]
MALLQKEYKAPANGLVISITLNDQLNSFHLIGIRCKDDATCQFRLSNQNQHLTNTRIQYTSPNGYHVDGSLAVEPSDGSSGGAQIRANLRFGRGNETRFAHLNDIVILRFERAGGLSPPLIADADEDPQQNADPQFNTDPAVHPTLERGAHEGRLEDLFPYIYLRKWPQPTSAALELAFVQFPAASASAVFYAALTAQPGLTREQMHSEALLFRAGSGKYTGLYVADCGQLQGVVLRLPAVAEAICAHAATPAELLATIPPLLYVQQSEVITCLNSPDYVANIERIWQSYFVQLILEDDDTHLLVDYTHLLVTDHILRALFAPAAQITTADLSTLRGASILLPNALFPLPPATTIGSTANAAIRVCAIGELKMVRQALVRYEAGELAHVENIMPGERREIRRTRASGQHLSNT